MIGGAPGGGAVEDQDARQIASFGILSSELALIQGYHAEKAEQRANTRK